MKQTTSVISTYSSDTFGVCSALFELGGMVVMHDPSGCNSTYTTHDEPRWYDTDSMIYISGLTEIDAIMGNDNKLICDIVDTAKDLQPAFIAVAGTPIPLMMGTDFAAIASVIEQETGIPSFGFFTNGMHSYVPGAAEAFEMLARRVVQEVPVRQQGSRLRVNILGLTPLDFSINGSDQSLKAFLTDKGFQVHSTWAMGDTLENIGRSGEADVNLVVSSTGLRAARELQRRFAIPYVAGLPVGPVLADRIAQALQEAARTGQSQVLPLPRGPEGQAASTTIIGEYLTSTSLAAALTASSGQAVRVICPLEREGLELDSHDVCDLSEAEMAQLLQDSSVILADPLYKPICPAGSRFISLPHVGFSGRTYLKDIPDLIGGFTEFQKHNQL